MRVNCWQIEEQNKWTKLLEFLYYNTYSNPQKIEKTPLQWFFKPLKDILHTLYVSETRRALWGIIMI